MMIPLLRDPTPHPADAPPPRTGIRDSGDEARPSAFDLEVNRAATGPDRPGQQETPPQPLAPSRSPSDATSDTGATSDTDAAPASPAETPQDTPETSGQDHGPEEPQDGSLLPALAMGLPGQLIAAMVPGATAPRPVDGDTPTGQGRAMAVPGATAEDGGNGLPGGRRIPAGDPAVTESRGKSGQIIAAATPAALATTGPAMGTDTDARPASGDVGSKPTGEVSTGRIATDQAAPTADPRIAAAGATGAVVAGITAGAVSAPLDPARGTGPSEDRRARLHGQPPAPADPAVRATAQVTATAPVPVPASVLLAGTQTAPGPLPGDDPLSGAGLSQAGVADGQDGIGIPAAPATLSSAPGAATPAMVPPPPASVSQQIVSALSQSGNGQVDLVLSPEELGRVRLSLSAHDAGITVHVTTERPETLALIRRHIDILAQDFRAIGYESVAFGFSDQSGAQGRGAGPTGAGDRGFVQDAGSAIGDAAARSVPEITLATGRTSGLDLRL